MNDQFKLFASRNYMADGVDVYLRTETQLASAVVTFSPYTNGTYAEPTFRIPEKSAQQLFDALWRDGFRPEGFNDSSISAQAKHLGDMRVIAGKFLEVELP